MAFCVPDSAQASLWVESSSVQCTSTSLLLHYKMELRGMSHTQVSLDQQLFCNACPCYCVLTGAVSVLTLSLCQPRSLPYPEIPVYSPLTAGTEQKGP